MFEWLRRKPKRQAGAGPQDLAAVARQHLAPDEAERWLALQRPALRLDRARAGEPVVARLGGLPVLPPDAEWPVWEGHGPLSYIGEIHCGAIDPATLDIGLPATGRMLFFYFDGTYDDFQTIVGTWDAKTLAGARMLYVPDGVPAEPRRAPEGVPTFGEARLAGRPIVTTPNYDHPLVVDSDFDGVDEDDFLNALDDIQGGAGHQIGGYAGAIQSPVEEDVAAAALGNRVRHRSDAHKAEARRWTPLFQVESEDDLGMTWGDGGALYWLSRREELDGRIPPSQPLFTWQCY